MKNIFANRLSKVTRRGLCVSLILFSINIISHAQPVVIGEYTEATLNAWKQNYHPEKLIRATTERSDTIDLLHFDIHLSVSDAVAQTIAGYSDIQFNAQMNNVSQIFLDLLRMNIDSVTQNGVPLTFTYDDSVILKVNLTAVMNMNDSSAIKVFYHGQPFNDNSFGGTWFSGDYAFNVGMSLYENPHNMGRTWHPCYDNFVERVTYEFHITSDSNRMALCNGALLDTLHNADGTVTWHWKQIETVPTFITGFALSKYTPVHWTFSGINGPMPVLLGAEPADTTDMKNSFVNLEQCFDIFESHYGAYPWNKVGFNALPFGGGAMEHAGSVVYPLFACDGSLLYEDLYAHELGHHWWGNEVTPMDASEIWLKEGMAVFSEFLFYEGVYGEATYQTKVADNHEISLHYAHVFDDGYQTLSPMPAFTTFGRTTYTKSADVFNTLKSYMGDSLFYGCMKSFIQSHQFQNYTSADLRDYLSVCSGINLNYFFDDWVFAPGFPHFSIDSFDVQPSGGSYIVTTHVRQRLDHAPNYYHHVPMEITYMNSAMQQVTERFEASGPCTVYQTTLSFNPTFVGLDINDKISDAITDDNKILKAVGTQSFSHGKMNLSVQTITDSAFVRIEHNFVAPDKMQTPISHLHLSQERYWKVDGIFPAGFDTKATLTYNGTNTQPATSYNGGYLDRALITNAEDSMRVMYRPSVSADWSIETDVSFNYLGSHLDKKGSITINHLKKGEYALAIYQANKIDSLILPVADSCFTIVAQKNIAVAENKLSVYPNPTERELIIDNGQLIISSIEISNLLGQVVLSEKYSSPKNMVQLNVASLPKGMYLLSVFTAEGKEVRKIVVE